ncbi:vacuolar protein-sorting-associated protein 36 [Bradysia coprophila]|uniref:vacuolar protein-sorting-associated protein 36 n=1 Tax=Bradysia coprophila TaxID=38358 RepID=UPI00187D90AF|nr:vacuolar protein-sorting-associated protein 36 [Bradysia coprophila]
MNRFEYAPAQFREDEDFVSKDKSVKLYDGDEKTSYEDGEVILTTHRLFWGRPGEISRGMTVLCLQLKYVQSIDEETASSFVFGRKKRTILHLSLPERDKTPGPSNSSSANFIKLSGRNGMDEEFVKSLKETVSAKVWQTAVSNQTASAANTKVPRIKLRTGIVGIERNLQEKQKQTDDSIQLAFQDLNKLMKMAKEMVGLSALISTKIRERQGDISEDETVRFKSYLMSLGIDDPVTRDGYQSNSEYYTNLSRQICQIMLDPITEAGGMMSLADVYCRVNRARGLELLSPEDLLNACKVMSGPVKLRQFPSGAMVLQLESHDEEAVAVATTEIVEEKKSMSVEELARILSISMILAQERLLIAERAGNLCRDESMEGLRFYPNLFLKNQ